MKTVLKFLYIIVVFFAIMLIQQSGGAAGMRVSQYISNNFHEHPDDPDYTVAIISGVLGTYGDPDRSNWTEIDITTADGRFDFTITLIPFGGRFNRVWGPQTHNGVDYYLEFRNDGFYIWLSRDDSLDEEFEHIHLIFNSINLDSPGDQIIRSDIWIQRDGTAGTQILPVGWSMFSYVENVLMTNIIQRYGEDTPMSHLNFSTLGNYNTNQLVVTTDSLENEFIFRASEPGADRPILNFVPGFFDGFVGEDFISEELMFFSARLFPDEELHNLTVEELETLAGENLILFVNPDLSPYWWWYLIIWSMYVILALIIPYFWMFRRPLKEALAVRKEAKKRQQIAKQKTAGSVAPNERKYKTVQEGQKLKDHNKQDQKNVSNSSIINESKINTDEPQNDLTDKPESSKKNKT